MAFNIMGARKTRDKNYNLGEMWKISKELSEKRKSISGKDEIKEKHLVNKYDKRIKNNEINQSLKLINFNNLNEDIIISGTAYCCNIDKIKNKADAIKGIFSKLINFNVSLKRSNF